MVCHRKACHSLLSTRSPSEQAASLFYNFAMSRLSLVVSVASAVLSCFVAGAQSIGTNSPGGEPLSERVVAYTIDAKLDTQNKTLDATETLAYRNLTGQALDSFLTKRTAMAASERQRAAFRPRRSAPSKSRPSPLTVTVTSRRA
jgi:hypothetical protein